MLFVLIILNFQQEFHIKEELIQQMGFFIKMIYHIKDEESMKDSKNLTKKEKKILIEKELSNIMQKHKKIKIAKKDMLTNFINFF